ncbi:MAG: GNAT family N-acetyltransferase [Armatimonadota bacterium]
MYITESFAILDAAIDSDKQKWLSLWESCPQREVFAHPNYVQFFAEGSNRALCATYCTSTACVLYPFILRDLSQEEYCSGEAFDIITPYGYGGPFVWGTDLASCDMADGFWASFKKWAEDKCIVSEFIRFTLFPNDVLEYPGDKEFKYLNVVRSLDLDDDDLWMDFEHKVRKNVNKSRRSGVCVEFDCEGHRLNDFLHIYNTTMNRRSADQDYYFSRDFFEKINSDLSGQFVYAHALYDGVVVSTELVLISSERVYSFLGGTNSEAFNLRPNDLLKYEIMRWAKNRGKHWFVLGGGYCPEDGIFRYKQSFAPSGCVPFYVGKRVFRQDLYDGLVQKKRLLLAKKGQKWIPKPVFFPCYRA